MRTRQFETVARIIQFTQIQTAFTLPDQRIDAVGRQIYGVAKMFCRL